MTDKVIMIVEDEGIVALDLKQRIQRMGYHPIVALSGREAIRLTRQLHPELVLLDIRLNGDLDGIEVAAKIRDEFSIPIIYISALLDEATKQRAELTQPLEYIEKPFTDEDIQAAINEAFKK
jgi:CheY-like chemotaxis protein